MPYTEVNASKSDTNPSGTRVFFDERGHRYYTDTGILLTSVTTFIGSYFPHFDAQAVSEKYAIKNNMAQADVLKMWKEKGRKASILGTAVHDYCEGRLAGTSPKCSHPETERYKALLETAERACTMLEKRFRFVAAEKIVFSVPFGLAGQIDLLMENPENGNIIIFDWKSNEKIQRENFWRNANSPICHMQDCNFMKYSLQLSTYKTILKQEGYHPNVNYSMMLIHLQPNYIDWIRVDDIYEEDIKAMLEWV